MCNGWCDVFNVQEWEPRLKNAMHVQEMPHLLDDELLVLSSYKRDPFHDAVASFFCRNWAHEETRADSFGPPGMFLVYRIGDPPSWLGQQLAWHQISSCWTLCLEKTFRQLHLVAWVRSMVLNGSFLDLFGTWNEEKATAPEGLLGCALLHQVCPCKVHSCLHVGATVVLGQKSRRVRLAVRFPGRVTHFSWLYQSWFLSHYPPGYKVRVRGGREGRDPCDWWGWGITQRCSQGSVDEP